MPRQPTTVQFPLSQRNPLSSEKLPSGKSTISRPSATAKHRRRRHLNAPREHLPSPNAVQSSCQGIAVFASGAPAFITAQRRANIAHAALVTHSLCNQPVDQHNGRQWQHASPQFHQSANESSNFQPPVINHRTSLSLPPQLTTTAPSIALQRKQTHTAPLSLSTPI